MLDGKKIFFNKEKKKKEKAVRKAWPSQLAGDVKWQWGLVWYESKTIETANKQARVLTDSKPKLVTPGNR